MQAAARLCKQFRWRDSLCVYDLRRPTDFTREAQHLSGAEPLRLKVSWNIRQTFKSRFRFWWTVSGGEVLVHPFSLYIRQTSNMRFTVVSTVSGGDVLGFQFVWDIRQSHKQMLVQSIVFLEPGRDRLRHSYVFGYVGVGRLEMVHFGYPKLGKWRMDIFSLIHFTETFENSIWLNI